MHCFRAKCKQIAFFILKSCALKSEFLAVYTLSSDNLFPCSKISDRKSFTSYFVYASKFKIEPTVLMASDIAIDIFLKM